MGGYCPAAARPRETVDIWRRR